MPNRFHNTPVTGLVDQLGSVKAAIAQLAVKEKDLKEALIAHGVGAYAGELFDATVTVSERDTLDMEAVRAKLTPQFITAHTRTTVVTTVKVVAKVRDRNAA